MLKQILKQKHSKFAAHVLAVVTLFEILTFTPHALGMNKSNINKEEENKLIAKKEITATEKLFLQYENEDFYCENIFSFIKQEDLLKFRLVNNFFKRIVVVYSKKFKPIKLKEITRKNYAAFIEFIEKKAKNNENDNKNGCLNIFKFLKKRTQDYKNDPKDNVFDFYVAIKTMIKHDNIYADIFMERKKPINLNSYKKILTLLKNKILKLELCTYQTGKIIILLPENLESLNLKGSYIKNYACLKNTPNLKELSIDRSFTAKDFKYLPKTLEKLDLSELTYNKPYIDKKNERLYHMK